MIKARSLKCNLDTIFKLISSLVNLQHPVLTFCKNIKESLLFSIKNVLSLKVHQKSRYTYMTKNWFFYYADFIVLLG